MAIVTLADLKAHLNLTSAAHDDELRTHLDAASEAVEHVVGPVGQHSHTTAPSGGLLTTWP